MITIHNTLQRQKQALEPLQDKHIRLYVCGITVYDYCHLGHARFLVVFDTVVRYLRQQGYQVTYVRNITDIDDKIIKRANQQKRNWRELTDEFITKMQEDCAALGVLPPDMEPRATEHMAQIIAMIEQLIAKGHAYAGDNGDVYYAVGSFADYGKLSNKRTDELRIGARVDANEAKRDALDFVVWKAAKPGEPAWESPWGMGRPGWHIECSAMSTHCLGNHFDIHGGGLDLKFPHHENEIAQSVGATGAPFANYWMHNGFVQVNAEKMSKSLGNFMTIRDLLAEHRAEVVRYFILNSHYRSPLDYEDNSLQAAANSLGRLYTALRGLPAASPAVGEPYSLRFHAAMEDDFNTPLAIAELFNLAHEINRVRGADLQRAAALAATLQQLAAPLGLLQQDAQDYFQGQSHAGPSAEHIEQQIAARQAARAQRDFAEADRIRDALLAQGIKLEDGAGGTTWSRAS